MTQKQLQTLVIIFAIYLANIMLCNKFPQLFYAAHLLTGWTIIGLFAYVGNKIILPIANSVSYSAQPTVKIGIGSGFLPVALFFFIKSFALDLSIYENLICVVQLALLELYLLMKS